MTVCFDDSFSMLGILSNGLNNSHSHGSLGFMVESCRELLNAFQYAEDLTPTVIQNIMDQYAKHIRDYVLQKQDLPPKVQFRRSLIDTVGPDLCAHIVSFLSAESLGSAVTVCKTFHDLVLKNVCKHINVAVNPTKVSLERSYGNWQLDFEFEKFRWDLVEVLVCDFAVPDDLSFNTLLAEMRKIKNLKVLDIGILRNEDDVQWVEFCKRIIPYHSHTLQEVRLLVQSCELTHQQRQDWSDVFSRLSLKTFYISILQDGKGLNENFLSILPNSIESLSLHLPSDTYSVDFSLLCKLNLQYPSVFNVFVSEDQFPKFLQVASNVSILRLRNAHFSPIIALETRMLPSQLKKLNFSCRGNDMAGIHFLNVVSRRLESLHFEPTPECIGL
jgi:hypothetical protein